jgi:predicted permease
MDKLLQDLRYALRQLGSHLGFTVAALLTLSLGIAINTTIFSAVSAVLLRKPPVHDPDRVMVILSTNRAEGWNGNPEKPVSAPDFMAWREQNSGRSLAEMAAVKARESFTLTGSGAPEHVAGMSVSANYFSLLEVPAAIGRTFVSDDGGLSTSHVAVISHEFWVNHFAESPQVLGTTVSLNDEPYTIVGIMPERFKLLEFPADIWIPLVLETGQLSETARASRTLYAFARLKPGIAKEAAQAEIANIAANLERGYPKTNKGWEVRLLPIQEFQILDGHVSSGLTVLMGAVGFVLLTACANISGLLLGRGAARQREFAIRVALGANRLRMFRQLFSESLLIAVSGIGLGLLLSVVGMRVLSAALDFSNYMRTWELRIDFRVLLFTVAVSLATAILFGFLPAMKFSKADPNIGLKDGGQSGRMSRSNSWSWRLLVSGEVTLALILLTAAGLMAKSFLEEIGLYPGFNARSLLVAGIDLPEKRYPDAAKQTAFFLSAVRRLKDLPGVESATVAGSLPLAANAWKVPIVFEGQSLSANSEAEKQAAKARSYVVGPDYWQTMQIPLIQGRLLQDSDTPQTQSVAVVNQTLAKRFFPKGDAIGRRILVDASEAKEPAWLLIVGVVGDVQDWIGQPNHDPQVYRPFLQSPQRAMTLVARTGMETTAAASAIQGAIWAVDKDQALTRMMTMSKLIDERGAGGDRVMGQLLDIFAGMALLMAAIGIYGIVAFTAARRTREIGIRLAVGADRRDVLGLILSDGLKLAALGLVPGFAVSLILPKLFGSVFSGFHVHPAVVLLVGPAVLLIVAIAATYVPAYRATKLDPMMALRYE